MVLVRIKWTGGNFEERNMDRVPMKDEVIWQLGNNNLQYVSEVHWRNDGGATLLMTERKYNVAT